MTKAMRVIIRGWDQDEPSARSGWAAKFHIRSTCPALVTARKNTETDAEIEHILRLSEAIEYGWSPCGRCAKGVSPTAPSLGDWPDEVEIEDEAAKAAEESRSRGQGFASSPQVRKAVDTLAMGAATAHFEAKGFLIKDVSGNHPYDLEGVRGDELLHIEVKGTQTEGSKVFLTKNEVRHARERAGQVALFVLHSVEVTGDEETPVASGGVARVFWPWAVDDGELTALSFSYVVPSAD